MPLSSLKQRLGQTWERVRFLLLFIWVIIGFIAGIITYWSWEHRKLANEGVSAVARVTNIKAIPRKNGSVTSMFNVSVSFNTPNKGTREESIYRSDFKVRGLKVGDPVNIRYLPDDPSTIEEEPLTDFGKAALYAALAIPCSAVLVFVIALFRNNCTAEIRN